MSYKLVSSHAEDLADGSVVAPGEVIPKLDEKDPHNKRLLDEGRLIKVSEAKKSPANNDKNGGDDA